MLLKLTDSRNLQQLLNSSGDKRKTNTNVDPKRFIEIYIEIKKEKKFKILYRKTNYLHQFPLQCTFLGI